MLNGFHGLRHDAVIGSHHQHHDIGGCGTAGTHGGKRGMARGVNEGDNAALLGLHMIGTDLLGNAAGLSGSNLGLSDIVQEGGLAVVYMAHDGHHRRTRLGMAGHVTVGEHLFLQLVFLAENNLVSHFLGHHLSGFLVNHLVDGHHVAELHDHLDNLGSLYGHLFGKLGNGNGFADLHFSHDLHGGLLEAVSLLIGTGGSLKLLSADLLITVAGIPVILFLALAGLALLSLGTASSAALLLLALLLLFGFLDIPGGTVILVILGMGAGFLFLLPALLVLLQNSQGLFVLTLYRLSIAAGAFLLLSLAKLESFLFLLKTSGLLLGRFLNLCLQGFLAGLLGLLPAGLGTGLYLSLALFGFGLGALPAFLFETLLLGFLAILSFNVLGSGNSEGALLLDNYSGTVIVLIGANAASGGRSPSGTGIAGQLPLKFSVFVFFCHITNSL